MTAHVDAGRATVPDQLRLLAEDHPDACAISLVGVGELTFGAWESGANRVAHALLAHDLRPGDRVAVVLDRADLLAHAQLQVGIQRVGGVVVPVDDGLADGAVAGMVETIDPALLVVPAARAHVVASPRDRAVVVLPAGDGAHHVVEGSELWHDDSSDVGVVLAPGDPCAIVHTSGTTGTPRGVLLRHRDALQLPVSRPSWSGDGFGHASAVSTVAGQAFLFTPMQMGMTAVALPRFDGGTFLDLVEDGRVSIAFLVPTMVELLLRRPDLASRDLSGLRLVTVGGAAARTDAVLALADLLPAGHVLVAYASSESGRARVMATADDLRRHPGTVGRPTPPTRVRVVDRTGAEVPPGRTGEVELWAPPDARREYVDDPVATARTWRDGWLATGDLGLLDEDGLLHIVGRAKDVVIRGGHTIHAADVEAVLAEHPAVTAVAVVAAPDALLGEEVAAAVVAAGTVSADELREWCTTRLASRCAPRHVLFLDELPVGASGKVDKPALRLAVVDAASAARVVGS